MKSPLVTAFYNAYAAEHSSKLIVFGWTNQGGWIPELSFNGQEYELTFSGEGYTNAITPFITSIEINGEPRSIDVIDANGTHQVQVFGLKTAGSGGNMPGTWVQSP